MRDLQYAIQEKIPGRIFPSYKFIMKLKSIFNINIILISGAIVKGKIGRRTSFEVTVDGKLIHSKLQTGGFPDRNEVVEIVQDVSGGSEPRKVVRSAKTCTIL